MPTQHYKNAPIAEAIINVQFRQEGGFDCASIRNFGKIFAQRFPTQAPIHFVEFNVSALQPDANTATAQAPVPTEVGLRLTNATHDRVLQLQRGSFAFSHLAPYTSWEPFRNDARELWDTFVENYASISVTRCAVRFINKIAIPQPSIELHEYFNLYPKIPEGIPQDVNGMLLQLQMPQPDLNATAVVNLALAQPELPDHMTVMLDIDLFSEKDNLAAQSEEVWTALDQARHRKNQLFEAFITDATRRIIS